MKNLFNRLFVLSLSLFASDFAYGQLAIPIGGWREHIPFNKAVDVTEDGNGKVYCASKFGMFTYSKNDGEINVFSRLNALSDLEISLIRYDRQTGVLMIAYQNSNLDILFPDNRIVNLSDIKQKSIIGGKQINSIYFLNRLAYLGTAFGIVVVDIDRKEIKDTYYIGSNGGNINVNGVAFDGSYLIAATDSGLLKADYNNPNIFNYTAWTKDTTLVEPNVPYTSLTILNGRVYVVKTNPAAGKDSVLVFSNNQWQPFISEDTEGGYVDSYNNFIIYRNKVNIAIYDESANAINGLAIWGLPIPEDETIRRGFQDVGGNLWIADIHAGLILKRPDGSISYIYPNGPRSESVWAMDSKRGKLWIASGSIQGDAPVWLEKNGISYFSDNTWKTFDCSNDNIYKFICDNSSPAVVSVAVDPSDPEHAYIASWGSGVLEFTKDGGVAKFNSSNSTLHEVFANYLLVGGVAFDDDGNLWAVAGGNSTRPISVRKTNGSWQDFLISETAVSGYGLYGLIVDDFGQKWFGAREGSSTGKGLCVYKESNLDSPLNGSFRRLTNAEGNGSLPDLLVRSLAKDRDGSIWVGTSKGVVVIYNPGSVFPGGSFDAQRIIIQQDGTNQYLLEAEAVTAIAVDGANRKWFGTQSGGAFLMSADGTKQVSNFNTDNSPLPSNSIKAIAVDDLTGEVFIATDKGIVSYRGDATEGGEACQDYFVYPNPVRSEYNGPIAVSGLVTDADVRISDVAGNVVYRTKANGGQAIWNGKNFSGERVKTGVYFVLVTNEDGSQTCSTKLLIGN